MSNSVRRKRQNTRKAIFKFINGRKRKAEMRTMTGEERDKKFFELFPNAKDLT